MTTNLHALLERLEDATGPDRELDALIALALDGAVGIVRASAEGRPNEPFLTQSADGEEDALEGYTASVDAALALVERVLPGWRVALNSDPHRVPLWSAQLKKSGDDWKLHGETAPIPALALCIAVVRAEIALREGG